MGSYKLSKKARADLKRIWLYGVKTHGNQRADQYHQGMLDRFALIAEQPYLYQVVDSSVLGTGVACMAPTAFITGSMAAQSKS